MPHYENWIDPPIGLSVTCGLKPAFPRVTLSDFVACDRTMHVVLTAEIWTKVGCIAQERLAPTAAVVRSLLFEALYGVTVYKQLLMHLRQQEQVQTHSTRDLSHECGVGDQLEEFIDETDPRFSRSRYTVVDLKELGKAETPRPLTCPARMILDLEIIAGARGDSLSLLVRSLMFRLVVGKHRADKWEAARAALDAGGRTRSERR